MALNRNNHSAADADTRKPAILHRADWASHEHLWQGYFQGKDMGTGITVLFYVTDKVGEGPRWHVHPYDEIFIVRTGNALFTIGDKKIAAKAGDILLGPAKIPHKYHNIGPGMLETTDIHHSDRWIQTNLDDPELAEN
ncbi:cupin domain-containing protein [Desulfopila sp. IMCC35006]|uniref:cupin domain-containing protein n=1 Tax=Desulfopila sp. IMCC35006 TaxID=2569542 RepID=UPI0010ACC95A|nr:cupin domain-containing protein [Desulfopila sp. IMCC35006]TKB25143.1 cupin domain-containing protein [Desulfopila sp. IMCC35006]